MEHKQDNLDIRKWHSFEEYRAPKDDRLRVAMVSNAYHGEVWPLVTLAVALGKLKQAGKFKYAVRLFVPENLLRLCTEHGLDAVAAFGDTRQAVEEAGGHGSTVQAGHAVSKALWFRRNDVLGALDVFKPGLAIVGNMWPDPVLNYEKDSGVPVIPIFFNRPYMDMALNVWGPRFKVLPRPLIYAMSDMLDTRELSRCVTRVGPLGQMDEGEVCDLPVELQNFLSRGPAPVAAGWGSVISLSPSASELLCMLLKALKSSGKRGVILGGLQGLDVIGQEFVMKGMLPGQSSSDAELADFAREHVFFAEHVPYESLLPECCCLIHHGGAGVTQTAMGVGCPQVVTPVCKGQIEHAARVAEAGVGINLISLSSVSARNLSDAIGSAVMMKDSALYFSSMLASEPGEKEVCQLIDGFVKEQLPQAGSCLGLTGPKTEKESQADEMAPEESDDDLGFGIKQQNAGSPKRTQMAAQ